jgi:hypothetical protein
MVPIFFSGAHHDLTAAVEIFLLSLIDLKERNPDNAMLSKLLCACMRMDSAHTKHYNGMARSTLKIKFVNTKSKLF